MSRTIKSNAVRKSTVRRRVKQQRKHKKQWNLARKLAMLPWRINKCCAR